MCEMTIFNLCANIFKFGTHLLLQLVQLLHLSILVVVLLLLLLLGALHPGLDRLESRGEFSELPFVILLLHLDLMLQSRNLKVIPSFRSYEKGRKIGFVQYCMALHAISLPLPHSLISSLPDSQAFHLWLDLSRLLTWKCHLTTIAIVISYHFPGLVVTG